MNGLNGLGRFEGKTHVMPLRVYYEDTDLSGLVYHANYLRFMERGRTEFFRLAGVAAMADLDGESPSAWTLLSANITYRRPARLDDLLEVRSILTAMSGARMTALQQIRNGDALLVEGRIEACVIALTGKPRRIPREVRELLAPFLYESET